jgi:hypothetical protein
MKEWRTSERDLLIGMKTPGTSCAISLDETSSFRKWESGANVSLANRDSLLWLKSNDINVSAPLNAPEPTAVTSKG